MSIGRRVVVPDLYGGATAATVADAEALAEATLDDPAALALVERCADAPAAEGAPWAAMGFSMGAFLACRLAARGAAAPDELVLFYGGQPPPRTDVGTRRADLHVVPDDPWCEDDELAAVEAGLRDAGTDVPSMATRGAGTGSPRPAPLGTSRAPPPWPGSGSSTASARRRDDPGVGPCAVAVHLDRWTCDLTRTAGRRGGLWKGWPRGGPCRRLEGTGPDDPVGVPHGRSRCSCA